MTCSSRLKNAGIVTLAASFLLITSIAVTPPAMAQSDDDAAEAIGGLLGVIIGAAMIDNARKAWNNVDSDVRGCLVQRYNISPSDQANHGIAPNDSRIVDYVNSCRQIVSQIREQQRIREEEQRAQQEAERQHQQLLQEQAEAAERQRQAEIAAAEAQRQAEIAAAEAKRVAKHRALVAKYGAAVADAVENHRIEVGMTKQAVLESCGEPDRAPEKVPGGIELWVYGSQRVVFTGNKVTSVSRI